MIQVRNLEVEKRCRMIIGIGIDIIELDRVKEMIENPRFLQRILTRRERQRYEILSEGRKVEFVAGRFAAKEAYAKAIGTGIGGELSFLDMEIINEESGKPVLVVETVHKVHISISHSRDYAVAHVIIESLSS
jgi:holo-[acyl-carrier protein] synthase